MANYEVSEASRANLIQSAGRLFAAYGVNGVPIRRIAAEAEINSSAVQYHFGGKDGLVDAVFDYASSPWKNHPIKTFAEENSELLRTQDGQKLLVTELIRIVFDTLRRNAQEEWCRVFFIYIIQRAYKRYGAVIKRCLQPDIQAFFEVYRKITGNDDRESAYCCFLSVLGPAYLYSGSPVLMDMVCPGGPLSPSFEKRLEHFTTEAALYTMKLLPTTTGEH